MSPRRPSSAADAQIHLPRVGDVVAEQIRELILLGELKDGERLPPLDTLIEQFRVSAPSMREALRILEAEGLLSVQRGSVGGAVVRRPTARTAAYTLALVLRSQSTNKGDVAEAIASLESLCASLCARRSDRKSKVVRELQKLNVAARKAVEGNEMDFNDTMLEFHRTIVRQCGNETLALQTRALSYIWIADVRTWVTSTLAHGHYPTADGRLEEVERHEKITELIEAGDDVGVAQAMTAHLDVSRFYGEGVDASDIVNPHAVRFNR